MVILAAVFTVAVLRREEVAFVFQSFNLVPTLSAGANISLPVVLAGKWPDPVWLETVVDQTRSRAPRRATTPTKDAQTCDRPQTSFCPSGQPVDLVMSKSGRRKGTQRTTKWPYLPLDPPELRW